MTSRTNTRTHWRPHHYHATLPYLCKYSDPLGCPKGPFSSSFLNQACQIASEKMGDFNGKKKFAQQKQQHPSITPINQRMRGTKNGDSLTKNHSSGATCFPLLLLTFHNVGSSTISVASISMHAASRTDSTQHTLHDFHSRAPTSV